MNHRKPALILGALGMLILILDSRAAALAAAEAVEICIKTVIPSLFPFFLLSGYLTGQLRGGRIVGKLYRCPESCGGLILTGLLAGYPVGAKLAGEQYRAGMISKALGNRLLTFCSQAGPSFLFGIVAAGVGGVRQGLALWAIQILSALTVAWLLPEVEAEEISAYSPGGGASPMESALTAMGHVCGWVIVFRVLISFLTRWVLWRLPEPVQILLCGALELTSGCLLLGRIENDHLRFLFAALMLNFGGLCVAMQTASVARGLDMRHYLRGKLLQIAISLLLSLAIFGKTWALIPVVWVFFRKIRPFSGKRGRNPRLLRV